MAIVLPAGVRRHVGVAHELILQIPMEPFGYVENDFETHTLLQTAGWEKNRAHLYWILARITNYVGVMNFLGSKFVSDQRALQPVFDDLADRGLLYLDNGRIRNNRSVIAARNAMLPFKTAGRVIDAVRSRQAIIQELQKLEQQAKRTGLAIGIATAFPETISLVAEFASKAAAAGIEITPLSAIYDVPSLSP